MKRDSKLEQLVALRRRRAEHRLKSIHAFLLEAGAIRAHLEAQFNQIDDHRNAWLNARATGNVIRDAENHEAGMHRVRIPWIESVTQAHDAQRQAHATEIDRLEACKSACLREIAKQVALQTEARRRRRAGTHLQMALQEEEEADEFFGRG
ncbi:hypothetical protein BGV47_27320 [Burkholderia ubonensis]|uniref:hypothetical protein n=1 Tax=Burkholderia ubonensis TaxID=101571 RepID=UPI0008FDB7DE|nr:hypothetical protein [Burkholderia ubonensis]OJA28510.1 hypothetical protein BGV47_27320 [Burkholderia ubonensis]OJB27106.1 hypothetical protein BGV55_19940 [Burkholderia ubonensis]